MQIDFTQASWINPPAHSHIDPDRIELVTDPGTDFWQRSYYGFRNDNAPALLLDSAENFTFTVRAAFDYRGQFDQCGVVIYLDSENWFKASIEYESPTLSRLGSVVTNLGYSDWATTDIPTPTAIWYRLNRRGPDFLIESALDAEGHSRYFRQMRVFHLHRLGETTGEMGRQEPPAAPLHGIRFGLYACSPTNSTFTATFTDFELEPCIWRAHGAG